MAKRKEATTEKTLLSAEEREELVRASGSEHAARWYLEVAHSVGHEVANRLSLRAARSLGKTEMRRLMALLGAKRPSTIEELVSLLETARDVFLPPPVMQTRFRIVDESTYEVEVEECFMAQNAVKTRMARRQVCAVSDRILGWHEALGLPPRRRSPVRSCTLVRGLGCRPVFEVAWTKAGRDGDRGG